jgi:hypothetical protein
MTEPKSKAKIGVSTAVIVLAMMSVAGLCVFVVVNVLAGADRINQMNRDGISCLLIQASDHRQNTYEAAAEAAEAGDYALSQPAPRPEPLSRELLQACERFLHAQ